MNINSPNLFANKIRNSVTQFVRECQGYTIREIAPKDCDKLRPGFNNFISEKRYMGGDYESILPNGAKLYIHSTSKYDNKLKRNVLDTVYKKLQLKSGKTLWSKCSENGKKVSVFEGDSVGPGIFDVANLKKLKTTK